MKAENGRRRVAGARNKAPRCAAPRCCVQVWRLNVERKSWSRFEILMPPPQKEALNSFAAELGLTPSALARLAINRLIADHELLPVPTDRRVA
jgi:hypothetical protein